MVVSPSGSSALPPLWSAMSGAVLPRSIFSPACCLAASPDPRSLTYPPSVLCVRNQEDVISHHRSSARYNSWRIVVVQDGQIRFYGEFRRGFCYPDSIHIRQAIQRAFVAWRNNVRFSEESSVMWEQELAIVVGKRDTCALFEISYLPLCGQLETFLAELTVGCFDRFHASNVPLDKIVR